MGRLKVGPGVVWGMIAAPLVVWGCSGASGPSLSGAPEDAGADATAPEGGNDATTVTDSGDAPSTDSGGQDALDSTVDASPDADADAGHQDAPATTDSTVDGGDAGDSAAGGDANDAASGVDGTGSEAAADAADAGGILTFSIDMNLGPARQFHPPSQPAAIASTIYGINTTGPFGAGNFVQQKTRWGLIRRSSDAHTDWNWTNNYLNQGALGCFGQGQTGGGTALAGSLTQATDSIAAAQAKGEPYLAPVAIVDHLPASVANDVTGMCPADASDCSGGFALTKAANPNGLVFASVDAGSPAFVANAASKGSAYCLCPPGQTCDAGCTVSANPVYQDEFVNYLKASYASGGAAIFFELGNEPNYWGGTHPEIWPFSGAPQCTSFVVNYDDITGRDLQFAAAVKSAWANALVFGPAVGQDGVLYAHSYQNDPHYPTLFVDYYLQRMAAAAADGGPPLLDVFDVHYYTAGSNVASQCVQNPRMFWDPGYTALSASATDGVDFAWAGLNNDFDNNWYPREMIPRLFGRIATAYASSGSATPTLAFGEYNSGCEDAVAGAIAEADVLGVFGREGVFAAAAMPLKSLTGNYLVAAFDLYRNYDGNGATVGDMAVRATTTNDAASSVYAFAHSGNASALDLVATNKTTASLPVSVSIANAPALTTATLYNIVSASAAVVAVGGSPPVVACASGTCSLSYTMPPMSATTFVLR